MEHLFSPCTRYRNLLQSRGCLGSHEWSQEQNLDVSTEEFLERAFTYADLYAMLRNLDTITWLTPHAAVAREGERAVHSWRQVDESCRFRFNADGKIIHAFALSPEHLLEICHVVVRLLAESVVHSVRLDNRRFFDGVLINAPVLAYLMEQCQSLKVLSLEDREMDENHCRVLGVFSRPGLEIELHSCKFTSAGISALAEVLGRNQGPSKLYDCEIDYSVLANGLRGNSRLKSLSLRIFSDSDILTYLLAIAGGLRENKGLIELELWNDIRISDETWDTFFDSLKTHPTLQVLNFQERLGFDGTVPLSPAMLNFRMQALADMLRANISIHTMHWDFRYSEHEIFQGTIVPYLETNRLRPRVRAIQKARPISYRTKVLSRALLAVRSDPNRFWMLLSENAEVLFA
jgi:hypothetical protein